MTQYPDKENIPQRLMVYFNNKKNPPVIIKGVYLSDIIGMKVERKNVYIHLTDIPYPIRIYERMHEVITLMENQQLSIHFCSCRSVTLSLYYYNKLDKAAKKASFFKYLQRKFNWKISRYARSVFYKKLEKYR